MYDVQHDIAILRSILNDFVPFIQSDVVFWQLSDSGPFLNRYPKLTVAGTLFCKHKLETVDGQLDHKIQKEKRKLILCLNEHLSKWHANVKRKTYVEILGRLRSWEMYIVECLEDANDCSQHYLEEVYGRVYIQLLLDVLDKTKETHTILARINKCDTNLYRVFRKGSFLWDSSLQVAFPVTNQWYLYGRPKTS